MARCGCQGAGSTTCTAIIRCVAGSLGPGLQFDSQSGVIQARVSRDAGNCIRYGSDVGLYVPCDGGGGGGGGGRTVDGLPDIVVAGTAGGAANVHAYASPAAIEYAVAQRLDIIDVQSWALADGIAAWAPYGPQTQIAFFTSNPSTEPARNMSSNQWVQLVSDSGVTDGNPVGRNSGAPAEDLVPDGGWYGWRQAPYQLMTVTQGINHVAGRCVIALTHGHDGSYDVAAIAQAILITQSQDSVIPFVFPTALSTVQDYVNLGINHVGVNVGLNTTVTAAEITASGATWVKIDERQGLSRVSEFISAGLNVLSAMNQRQTTAAEVLALGARGLVSNDPVYTRGAIGPEWLGYRRTQVPMSTRMTEIGTQTPRTDELDVLSAVGYALADRPGRFFPPRFGWDGDTPRNLNNQLVGQPCPFPDPSAYTFTLSTMVRESTLPPGSAPKLGILTSVDNDLDPSSLAGQPTPETRHGYVGFVRVGSGASNGEMVLGKYSPTGDFTQLASGMGPAVTAGSTIQLELEVAADVVFFRRLDGGTVEIQATDTDWRGEYGFYLWEDVVGGSGGAFEHGYWNVSIVPTSTGGANWQQVTLAYGTWSEFSAAAPTWSDAEQVPSPL